MRNLNKSTECAELKLSMIDNILKMDCKKWNENSKRKVMFYLDEMDFNDEIQKTDKDNEVSNMEFFLSLGMPQSFFIDDIEVTFKENIFKCDYVHIYFIKNTNGISLLFRFNTIDKNDHLNIKFNSDERLYELKNNKLINIIESDAKKYIEAFKDLYDSKKFNLNESAYTQYITFEYNKIRKNFKQFSKTTQLITAAKKEGLLFRLNIILQIERLFCKDPKTVENDAYYNIGNMQP